MKNILKFTIFLASLLIYGEAYAQPAFGTGNQGGPGCPTNLFLVSCPGGLGTTTLSPPDETNPNASQAGLQLCSDDGSTLSVTMDITNLGQDTDVQVFDGNNYYNDTQIGTASPFSGGFLDGDGTVITAGPTHTYTSTTGCITFQAAEFGTAGTFDISIACGAASGNPGIGQGATVAMAFPPNDYCANAHLMPNAHDVTDPATPLAANVVAATNLDATSGPGDSSCDPTPDTNGQSTSETTVWFQYCTGATPGTFGGAGIQNESNCVNATILDNLGVPLLTGGLGSAVANGTFYTACGTSATVTYAVGDQLLANTCYYWHVDGLNGDECDFETYFIEVPPPFCEEEYAFSVEDVCSGTAPTFTPDAGCTEGPNNELDLDWYMYAPGGVAGTAPVGYDPLAAFGGVSNTFPLSDDNADLIGGSDGIGGTWAAPAIICKDLTVGASLTVTNQGCAPIVVTYFAMPWDRAFDTDGDGTSGEYNNVNAAACDMMRFDVTVYPETFTATTTGTTSPACSPMVTILAADGSTCRAAEAVTCAAGSYDYTSEYAWLAAANAVGGACTQTALSGAINCDAACIPACTPNAGTISTAP